MRNENDATPQSAAVPMRFSSIDKLTAEDAAARRNYAVWAAIAGACFQTLFVVHNRLSGHIVESYFDAASVLFASGIPVLLRIPRLEIWGYRLSAFVLIGVNVYTCGFISHDTAAVILGFYVVPVVIFYLLGLREGVRWLASVWIFLITYMIFPSMFSREQLAYSVICDVLVSFLFICTCSFLSEWFRRKSFNTYRASHDALLTALRQKETLGGLIPICSQCMKIRNDDGFWQNLESFIATHTAARVSSGICDACVEAGVEMTHPPEIENNDLHSQLSSWKFTDDTYLRKYIKYVSLAEVFVLAGYVISGVLQGNYVELAGQTVLGVALLVIALNLHWAKHVKLMYHATLLVTFLLLAFQFFTPTPNSTDHLWLYILPLTSFLVVGFWMGVVWSIVTLVLALVVFSQPYFTAKYQITVETMLFFTTTCTLLSFFSGTMEWMRQGYSSRIREVLAELQRVYGGIRTLRGLVPVCRECKSVRNDEGYWTRVDFYLLKHAEINLSHGICPECMRKTMPDLYDEIKDQDNFY